MKPLVLLISESSAQRQSWQATLAQQNVGGVAPDTRMLADLTAVAATPANDLVVVQAVDDEQQLQTLAQCQQRNVCALAVIAPAQSALCASALHLGVDYLSANDPLFEAALIHRVTMLTSLVVARRQLVVEQQLLRRMRREVSLAAQTQSRFRPPSPFVSGNLVLQHRVVAAGQLSGDCVDYFRLADGCLVFLVADVAGHGLSAALLTPLLKSFSLQLARSLLHSPLTELLANFGEDIAALNCGKHVAMFAGVVSADETRLRYCSAGHAPPPILVADGQVQLLAASGKPLGLFAGAQYIETEVALPAAFTLAVFSDGVLELIPGADLAARHAALGAMLKKNGNDLEALSRQLGLANVREFKDDIECLLLSRGVS